MTIPRRQRLSLLPWCLVLALSCACSRVDTTDWRTKDWNEIVQAARGTTVRFYMYGGWAHVNKWVDAVVAPKLKEKYDITLERAPMNAPVFVNKLLAEKGVHTLKGAIDLMWINGENFRNAMQAGLLFGPFAEKLPNFQAHADTAQAAMDFGYPTRGYECPFGLAQFVFEYDPAGGALPPRSFAELPAWVRAHPGRFTYPQPPDFTGSAFIRQAFYAVTGGHEQYMKGFDQALFATNAPKLWAYLKDIKPFLWQSGTSYAKDSAALDTLFARGEVDLNMSYHPPHAQNKILEGAYKDTVRTFLPAEGSLRNTHFTAIAWNAPNRPGAMVTADYLFSVEAQLSKYDPALWGDFPALDPSRLSAADAAAFKAVSLGAATLPIEAFAGHSVPEIPAAYLEALDKGWEENVLR